MGAGTLLGRLAHPDEMAGEFLCSAASCNVLPCRAVGFREAPCMVEMGEEIIVLDEVYKIFGPQPRGRAPSLDPRHIMEEMGRVENLIDDFEREVFM